MPLSEKFNNRCINRRQWIKKHNLKERTAYKVISGELTGEKNTNGATREVFQALLKDGIISQLPIGLRDK